MTPKQLTIKTITLISDGLINKRKWKSSTL